MIDGWIMLVITGAMSVAVFANGLRFARMKSNPWAGKTIFGHPVEGADFSVSKVQMIGKMQMFGAPAFFLFMIAVCFGLLGPVDGVNVIGSRL